MFERGATRRFYGITSNSWFFWHLIATVAFFFGTACHGLTPHKVIHISLFFGMPCAIPRATPSGLVKYPWREIHAADLVSRTSEYQISVRRDGAFVLMALPSFSRSVSLDGPQRTLLKMKRASPKSDRFSYPMK